MFAPVFLSLRYLVLKNESCSNYSPIIFTSELIVTETNEEIRPRYSCVGFDSSTTTVDLAFSRSSMQVSNQPLSLSNNRRALLTTAHSAMLINASPVAVRNKIKAIQARKARFTIPSYYDSTDIRPLNFSHGVASATANITVITAERLVDRSKDVRPSFTSNASSNQPVLPWTTSFNSSSDFNRKVPTNSSFTTFNESTRNKLTSVQMPRIRPSFSQQPQLPALTLPRRTHPAPIEDNPIRDDDDDDELSQYLEHSLMKCADWLMKYVFNEPIAKASK
jgi:hypothetical protein